MPRRARIVSEDWPGHVAVPDQVRPEHWPQVGADALSEDRRALFMRRKKGIELYFDGASEADIRAACGFGRSHIYRLITERCLAQHPAGSVNGWRGALPHRRVKEWSRTEPLALRAAGSGTAGALQWIFESPGGAQNRSQVPQTDHRQGIPTRVCQTTQAGAVHVVHQRAAGSWS